MTTGSSEPTVEVEESSLTSPDKMGVLLIASPCDREKFGDVGQLLVRIQEFHVTHVRHEHSDIVVDIGFLFQPV